MDSGERGLILARVSAKLAQRRRRIAGMAAFESRDVLGASRLRGLPEFERLVGAREMAGHGSILLFKLERCISGQKRAENLLVGSAPEPRDDLVE